MHNKKEDFNGLKRRSISHISLNIGIYCNQECMHCHLDAGPGKKDEVLRKDIIPKLIGYIEYARPESLEITGGAPELNKNIVELVRKIRPLVKKITMRSNLTAMPLSPYEDLVSFLSENSIGLVVSLPCHSKERVDVQRGKNVFEKSIKQLKRLNYAGFGMNGGVPLTLVFNPTDHSLPPGQKHIHKEFKERLMEEYGIRFTNLVAMTNVPIGRFAKYLKKNGIFDDYIQILSDNYNQANLRGLMCLDQVTIDWKGRFYDCDFNLAYGLPKDGFSDLDSYKQDKVIGRSIYTDYYCLACTAGAGSSCHGTLSE